MKNIHKIRKGLAVVIFLMTGSQLAFSQWSDIGSIPQKYYKILSFADESNAYAITQDSGVSDYHFYKSEDRGVKWQQMDPVFPLFEDAQIISIEFPDKQTGYMGFRANQGGLKAFVYKTSNGGGNWTDVTPSNLPVGFGTMDIHFVDSVFGFVLSGNRIMKTTDGGDNWTPFTIRTNGGLQAIDFYDDKNGIVGAWDGSFLYKGMIYTTDDGGNNWDSLDLKSYQSNVVKVSYPAPSTAFALTSGAFNGYHKLIRTIDSGTKWDTTAVILEDTNARISDFKFIDAKNGFLCTEGGEIYASTDSGATWSKEYSGKVGLLEMELGGSAVYAGGPLNTLVTNAVAIGIGEVSIGTEVLLYPNPISSSGILKFNTEQSGLLSIVNTMGEEVVREELTKVNSLNLSKYHLKPGTYFVKVGGKDTKVGKLQVKE